MNTDTPSGLIEISKSDVSFSKQELQTIFRLFNSRHSTRIFEKRTVKDDDILEAVRLAMRCPTACNRQPNKVYALSSDKREKLGFPNTYKASKYLIITTDMSAYTRSEYGDWIVTGSIFAAYLTLALHAIGIGCCVIRKDLVFGSEYNDVIRKICGIPKQEKIIIELAIGYYRDSFNVAVSNRKCPEMVFKSIE